MTRSQPDIRANVRHWGGGLAIAQDELENARSGLGEALLEGVEAGMQVTELARVAEISRPTAYKLIRVVRRRQAEWDAEQLESLEATRRERRLTDEEAAAYRQLVDRERAARDDELLR